VGFAGFFVFRNVEIPDMCKLELSKKSAKLHYCFFYHSVRRGNKEFHFVGIASLRVQNKTWLELYYLLQEISIICDNLLTFCLQK